MRGLAIPSSFGKLITPTLLKEYMAWAKTSQIRWKYLLHHFTNSDTDFLPTHTIDSLLNGCINNISSEIPIAPLLKMLMKSPSYYPKVQFLQSLRSIEDILNCMDILDENEVFTLQIPLDFLYSLLRRANSDKLRLKIESFIDKGAILGQIGIGKDEEFGRINNIIKFKNIITHPIKTAVDDSFATLSTSIINGASHPNDIKSFIKSSNNIKGIADLLLEYYQKQIVQEDDLMEFISFSHQRGEGKVVVDLLNSLGNSLTSDVQSFAIATLYPSTTSPFPLPPFNKDSSLLIRSIKANIKRCKWKSIYKFLKENSPFLLEIHLSIIYEVIARSNLKHKKNSLPICKYPLLNNFDCSTEWKDFISKTKGMDQQSLIIASLLKSQIYKKNPATPTANSNATAAVSPLKTKTKASGFCYNFFKVFSKFPPSDIESINLYLTFHIDRLSNKQSARAFLKRQQKEDEIGGFYYRMKNSSMNRWHDNVFFLPYTNLETNNVIQWCKEVINWLENCKITITPSFMTNLVHLSTITGDKELFSFVLSWIDNNPLCPVGRSFFRSLLPWFNGNNNLSPPLMDSELTFSPSIDSINRFLSIISKSNYKPDLSFYELLIPSLIDLHQWDRSITLLIEAINTSYHHNFLYFNEEGGEGYISSMKDLIIGCITRLWNSLSFREFIDLLERIKFESNIDIFSIIMRSPFSESFQKEIMVNNDLLALLLTINRDSPSLSDDIISFLIPKIDISSISSLKEEISPKNLAHINANIFRKRGVLSSKILFQKAMSTFLTPSPFKLSISKSLSYLHNSLCKGDIEEGKEIFLFMSTQYPGELTLPIGGSRRISLIGHSAIQEW